MASSSKQDARMFEDSPRNEGENAAVKNTEKNNKVEYTAAIGKPEQHDTASSDQVAGAYVPKRSYAAALSGNDVNKVNQPCTVVITQEKVSNEATSYENNVQPAVQENQSAHNTNQSSSRRHNGFRNRNFRRNSNFGSRFTGNFARTNCLWNNSYGFPPQVMNPYQYGGNTYTGALYTPAYHAPTTEFSSPRFQHNSQGYLQCNQDPMYGPNAPNRYNYALGPEQFNPQLVQEQCQTPMAYPSSYGFYPANYPMYANAPSCTSPSYNHMVASAELPHSSYGYENLRENGYAPNASNYDLVCPPVQIQMHSPRSGVPIVVPFPSQSNMQNISSPGPSLVHRFTPAHMGPEDISDVKELGMKQQATVSFDTWSSAIVLMEQRRKIKEKVGLVINNRYHVIQKISVGCYGDVFSALDTADPDRKMVAIKFEVKGDESHFKHEKEFYRIYTSSFGRYLFPRGIGELYWTGVQFGYKIVVMELLGPTLERLFNYCNRRFLKQTVYQLGMQFISRLEQIHNRGFVHRDLKPENFLMGTRNHESICYLIDFGLSRRYRVLNADGTLQHIKLRRRKHMIGTAKYCSILSHWGVELSRRDDMESLGYILIEFITGALPWKDSRFRDRSNGYGKIRQCKEQTDWGNVCPSMKSWIQYSRSLQYTEKPDYDRFRSFLNEFLMKDFPKAKQKFHDRTKEEQNYSTLTDLKALQSLVGGVPDDVVVEEAYMEEQPSQEEFDEQVLPQSENVNYQTSWPQSGEIIQDKGVDPGYIFEWQLRKSSSPSEKYTYDCLFSWLLPYGVYPEAPEGVCSNVFSYLPGGGGFA